LGLPKKLKLFLFISGVFALANFSYMFFILRAQSLFIGSNYAIVVPILLYILFNIFYAGFAIPFGRLSDKIGRKKVLLMGYSLFTFTSIGFAFFHSIIAYILLFAAYGLVKAIVDANQRAFVSDLATGDLQATSLGAYHTTIGLASLPASIIAGALWQITPASSFLFAAITSAIASLMLFFSRNNLK